MKIIVLSDTHVPTAAPSLPKQIEKELKTCDCCIHAGDFTDYTLYKKISSMVSLHAVAGNMDDDKIAEELPEKKIFQIEDVTIALAHGYGAPDMVRANIDKLFKDEHKNIDLFIFGHSHVPTDETIKGKRYFNPGSSTDKIFALRRTYGILTIEGKTITTRIADCE